LTQERINQLRSIGFEFELSTERRKQLSSTKSWDEYLAELRKFIEEKGHSEVPETTTLGEWLKEQRLALKARKQSKKGDSVNNSLTEEQMDELNLILNPSKTNPHGGHVKGHDGKSWEEWFGELLAHRIHAKTFRIPRTSVGLSHWVEEQRNEYAKYVNGMPSKLTLERISKLQEVKFPFNLKSRTGTSRKNKVKRSWEEMFTQLLQYHLNHGSFGVTRDRPDLHAWVQKQQKMFAEDSARHATESVPVHIHQQRFNKLRRVGFPFKSISSLLEPTRESLPRPQPAEAAMAYGPFPSLFFPHQHFLSNTSHLNEFHPAQQEQEDTNRIIQNVELK